MPRRSKRNCTTRDQQSPKPSVKNDKEQRKSRKRFMPESSSSESEDDSPPPRVVHIKQKLKSKDTGKNVASPTKTDSSSEIDRHQRHVVNIRPSSSTTFQSSYNDVDKVNPGETHSRRSLLNSSSASTSIANALSTPRSASKYKEPDEKKRDLSSDNKSIKSSAMSTSSNSQSSSSRRAVKPPDVNKMSIYDVLLYGENLSRSSEQDGPKLPQSISDSDSDSDDTDSSGWEDVDVPNEPVASTSQSQKPTAAIEVVIDRGGHQGRKKGFDPEDCIRRELNREKRVLQLLKHQVSILILLARGRYLNSILNNEEVLATAASILPSKQSYPPKKLDLSYLEKFLKWFVPKFAIHNPSILQDDLSSSGNNNNTHDKMNMEDKIIRQLSKGKVINSENKAFTFIAIFRSFGVLTRLVYSLPAVPKKPPYSDLMKKSKEEKPKVVIEHKAKVDSTDEEYSFDSDEDFVNKKPKRKSINKQQSASLQSTSSSSSQSVSSKKVLKKSPDVVDKRRKIVSSSDEESDKSKGIDIWPEVFVEEEERWVSVDLSTGKIMCDRELEKKARKPVLYVIAFDNDNNMKDITRRYASQWLTRTMKDRVDRDWLYDAIHPFKGKRTWRDKAEDKFLDQQLLSQGLPTQIQQYVNHPLYVLKKHLKKFEAIYPTNSQPIGCVGKQPVFRRELVHTLMGRFNWLLLGKSVCVDEQPYKVVKGRPKYCKVSGQKLAETSLELFGKWQVQEFKPLVAKDGKVPRSEYGNVELYQESMLPIGTVHLRCPGLQRIAKKLDIDCAPAVTGFDYRIGGSHPVLEGFVVCEEFKDILIDAWKQDQLEQRKRETDKRTKRAVGNWRKLLRGLLIREKVMVKYGLKIHKPSKDDEADSDDNSPSTSKGPKRPRLE